MTEVAKFSAGLSTVEVAARLLGHEDREAVLGDLAEAGESVWRGVAEVLGLVARRQAELWKSWRPWTAAFGLALPFSFLLMGFSLSVSWTYQHLMAARVLPSKGLTPGLELGLLICQLLLLASWAWTGGFVVGSLSRRTLWVSVAATCSPCLFCLARFRIASLSRVCLLLFLVPAVWGVWRGLRVKRMERSSAMVVAVGMTVLMICMWMSRGGWALNWVLMWPAWYLVAMARREEMMAR